MPQTFAEAVAVVRGLEYRYLWIDSLCIVQDSTTDWEIESSKMCDYYWNSALTIAAADSTDSSKGLFRPRDTAAVYPCLTSLKVQAPGIGVETLRPITLAPELDFRDWRAHHPNVLNYRGWTLQEQLLSRRLLLFERHQLSFSCLEMIASENRPCGRRRAHGDSGHIIGGREGQLPVLQCILRSVKVRWPFSVDDDLSRDRIYEAWSDMLSTYAKRELTKGSDALPALSGLASRFCEIAPDGIGESDYLAGLWRPQFRWGLLWYCSAWGRTARNEESGCPSWSPISVRAPGGEISFRDFNDANEETNHGTIDFRIISASTKVQGLNPFGQIVGSELRIRCPVKSATVASDACCDPNPGIPLQDPHTNERIGAMHRDVPGEMGSGGPVSVTCAAVTRTMRTMSESGVAIVCLILVAVGDGEPLRYRRVGLGTVEGHWLGDALPSEISIC